MVIDGKIITHVQEDHVSHSRLPYSRRTYRFRNLDRLKPEWLILDNSKGSSCRPDQRDLDPHEPVPGDVDGNYVQMNEFHFGFGFNNLFPSSSDMAKIPGTRTYHIHEPREKWININVPFVPYEHFQTSRAYRAGLSYVDYYEILRATRIGDDCNRTKEAWCKGKFSGRRELPVWLLSDSPVTVSRFHSHQVC